jgi:aminoglycoside phosphotransferase (APT) family kinase protein
MTVPLETATGVEPAALAAWMNDQGLGSGPISGIHRLTGGTQNILISFARDGRTYILRRPPLNKRSNSDETMIEALAAVARVDHIKLGLRTLGRSCWMTAAAISGISIS